MRRTKTLKFTISDPKEKELYDYLQQLPHGRFTEETKAYWRNRLNIKHEFNLKESVNR